MRANHGLMDQVAALHWVQENIGEFGGRPENVTVIGHGVGASCLHLLMLSPMAKGKLNLVDVYGDHNNKQQQQQPERDISTSTELFSRGARQGNFCI